MPLPEEPAGGRARSSRGPALAVPPGCRPVTASRLKIKPHAEAVNGGLISLGCRSGRWGEMRIVNRTAYPWQPQLFIIVNYSHSAGAAHGASRRRQRQIPPLKASPDATGRAPGRLEPGLAGSDGDIL